MNNLAFNIPVIENIYATERKQYIFPKHRRKRVLKKWAKNDKYCHNVPCAYMFENKLVCHPDIAKRLREKEIAK